jgi:hypothetical protein
VEHWSDAMTTAVDQPRVAPRHHGVSLSGISILLALALTAFEIYFFWGVGENALGLNGPLFGPDRLGFTMAWVVFIYLGVQLITIPFANSYREQFVGVLDGLASVVPLIVAAVAIVGHPELLQTEGRWEASILLLLCSLADLIGGFAITIGLSRRTVGFGAPVS